MTLGADHRAWVGTEGKATLGILAYVGSNVRCLRTFSVGSTHVVLSAGLDRVLAVKAELG